MNNKFKIKIIVQKDGTYTKKRKYFEIFAG